MPNFINRRKKKVKVPEPAVNCDCDSDSSSYGFSSKLNSSFATPPAHSQQQHVSAAFDKRKFSTKKHSSSSNGGNENADKISLKYVELNDIES